MLIPRETQFFDLLETLARTALKGARMLRECLEKPGSPQSMADASKYIHDVENDGDEIVHQLMARLNKTFITPLDREDIHELCSNLDDVLDFVDAVAKRLVTFRIQEVTPYALQLSRILEQSADEVARGVTLLRNLRQHDEIIRQCTVINQLENDADQVMRDALNDLFNGVKPDPLEVVKWMDLYRHLEIATDKCEDVANIMEGVLVKYS
jgi:predicted phosphate transport protein (TIGR00153 family)